MAAAGPALSVTNTTVGGTGSLAGGVNGNSPLGARMRAAAVRANPKLASTRQPTASSFGLMGQTSDPGGVGLLATNTGGGLAALFESSGYTLDVTNTTQGGTAASFEGTVNIASTGNNSQPGALFVQNNGTGQGNHGIVGVTLSTNGDAAGVIGLANGSAGQGVRGGTTSAAATGVSGYNAATSGPAIGISASTSSPQGVALTGYNAGDPNNGQAASFGGTVNITSNGDNATLSAANNATSGPANGIVVQTSSPAGIAINGTAANLASPAGSFLGTVGVTVSGGVNALSISNRATSGPANGLFVQTSSVSGVALVANNTASGPAASFGGTVGINGDSGGNCCLLYVTNTATSGTAHGVVGVTSSPQNASSGVIGIANGAYGNGVRGGAADATGVGVVGYNSAGGLAGQFNGSVQVNGNLNVSGSLYASSKNFKIDDPLDPDHKSLYHASIESSEMMNIYSGNVVLDRKGEAVITMPEWFEALNADFRYQLTAIGRNARVYIAQKIQNHQFKIAGGRPGMEVSWLVSGVRHDAWAQDHPMHVEEFKPQRDASTR